MTRVIKVICISLALPANLAEAAVGPGPAPFDTATACYNPLTGEIIISVNDIETWELRSASGSLTGASSNFPTIPGAFNSDLDDVIGQAVFSGAFTYFDHNLGAVAATDLPLSDLTLFYKFAFGPQAVTAPVTVCIPEPAGLTLMLFAGMGVLAARRCVSSRITSSPAVESER